MKKKKVSHESGKSNKQGLILLATTIIMAAFMIIYIYLLELLTLKAYSPDYFAWVKFPGLSHEMIFPFIFAIFFAVGFYIEPSRKTSNKKYIGCASFLLSVILIVTIVFSSNVWIFNKNTISYNTLFQKNKTVYSYDDIEQAKMTIEVTRAGMWGLATQLCYDLEMNDGKQIKFDAYDSFRKDDELLIAFDKAIADKRIVDGDFISFDNASDEFNEYFKSLYANSNPPV